MAEIKKQILTIYKHMGQPIKKNIKEIFHPKKQKIERTHASKLRAFKKRLMGGKEYGTSKLEERFGREFLDKLGIEYIYQYEMGTIKRFLDFFIPSVRVGIEIDGDYFHSYGLLYEQMNPMQRRNYRVDRQKDSWCRNNNVTLIRIWEHDINNNPEGVMNYLKDILGPCINNKKKRK